MIRKLPLTDREQKIWGYILGYMADNGYSPTRQEIADSLKFNNRQIVQVHLVNMMKKGYVDLKGRGWRNIKVITIKK